MVLTRTLYGEEAAKRPDLLPEQDKERIRTLSSAVAAVVGGAVGGSGGSNAADVLANAQIGGVVGRNAVVNNELHALDGNGNLAKEQDTEDHDLFNILQYLHRLGLIRKTDIPNSLFERLAAEGGYYRDLETGETVKQPSANYYRNLIFNQDSYISSEEATALMDKNPKIREIVASAEIKHNIETTSLLPNDEARRFAELAEKGRTRVSWGFWNDKGTFIGEAEVNEYATLYNREREARQLLNKYIQDSNSLSTVEIDKLSMILYDVSGNNIERAHAILESARNNARYGSISTFQGTEAKESAYQNARYLISRYQSPQHRIAEGVQIGGEVVAPYSKLSAAVLIPYRAMLFTKGAAQTGHGINQVAEGDTWQGLGNIFLGTVGGIAPGTLKYSSHGLFSGAEKVVQQEEIISQIVNRGGKLSPTGTTLFTPVTPATRPLWQASPSFRVGQWGSVVPKIEEPITQYGIGSRAQSLLIHSNSQYRYLDHPIENGILNIGAGNKPIPGAYNITLPKEGESLVNGVYPGDANRLANIPNHSQRTVIMENPYGFNPLNNEVLRVLHPEGQIVI